MATSTVDEIIEKYGRSEHNIISILQDVQDEYKHIPKEIMLEICEKLEIPLSRAYSIATFFTAFSLAPKGKHPISVCMGTACHVRGAPRIMGHIERDLGIKAGQTTQDGNFSLEEVHCLGCCGLAPVITVGDDLYGKIKLSKIDKVLKKYK